MVGFLLAILFFTPIGWCLICALARIGKEGLHWLHRRDVEYHRRLSLAALEARADLLLKEADPGLWEELQT